METRYDKGYFYKRGDSLRLEGGKLGFFLSIREIEASLDRGNARLKRGGTTSAEKTVARLSVIPFGKFRCSSRATSIAGEIRHSLCALGSVLPIASRGRSRRLQRHPGTRVPVS